MKSTKIIYMKNNMDNYNNEVYDKSDSEPTCVILECYISMLTLRCLKTTIANQSFHC